MIKGNFNWSGGEIWGETKEDNETLEKFYDLLDEDLKQGEEYGWLKRKDENGNIVLELIND